MRTPYKHRCICLLLTAVLLCLLQVSATADPAADGYEGLLGSLSGGDPVAWVSDVLPEEAGRGAEWYVIALSQSGAEYDFSSYAAALAAYLSETEVPGAVARQRYALAMLASGAESDYPSRTAADSIGQQGIMSWVFGLHLLHNGVSGAAYSEQEIVGKLLELQLEDGGWAVSGQYADVDVTAMVLQALADCETPCSEAMEAGLSLLSARQLADGGFQSYGTVNSESISQVIIALTALGIDPRTDERFLKNGASAPDALSAFRLEDGSFCHTVGGGRNETATVQAFLALTALRRQENGAGSLYLLDAAAAGKPTESVLEGLTSDAPETLPEQSGAEAAASLPEAEAGFRTARLIVLLAAILCALLSAGYLLAGAIRTKA